MNRPDDGKSRDPNGTYVRRWVPELRRLPTKHLCRPYSAPEQVLKLAEVVLGTTYPLPIVSDLTEARERTTEYTIECRRQFQEFNDAQGYDHIELPDFTQTKVFTKKEFRIDKQGKRLYGGDGELGSGSMRRNGGNGSGVDRGKKVNSKKKRARK